MKTTQLIFILFLFAFGLQAQEGFKLGLQAGLPIDDFNDEVSIAIGADVGYMWALNELIDLGLTAGLIYGFHETFQSDVVVADLPDIQFVPVAASVRIWPSNSFSFGIDGGQAFGLNDGNDGGLYYRPVIGYLFNANAEVNFSYTTINLDDRSWNSANLGILYTFPSNRR